MFRANVPADVPADVSRMKKAPGFLGPGLCL
jgi:hypothetical protein